MKLILGLGNPGRDYEATRHNVGWWLLDRVAELHRFEGWHRNLDASVSDGQIGSARVRLAKPLTYMNLSGSALRPYLGRTTFSVASDLLVVVDDVALPLGHFRLRADGSAGGHNGLKSIEQAVGSNRYARMRIGIRPESESALAHLADFVLSPLSRGERAVLSEMEPRLTAAVDTWVSEGILAAMNKHNRKTPPTE